MVRFFFRLLATAALAVAVIMAVLDATRSIAASSVVTTSLLSSWSATSAGTLSALQGAITAHLPAFVWDPLMVSLLRLPGFVIFAALALIFYAVGRRPGIPAGAFLAES
jgi:hypothetical protein